jgi:hypothetical protein
MFMVPDSYMYWTSLQRTGTFANSNKKGKEREALYELVKGRSENKEVTRSSYPHK